MIPMRRLVFLLTGCSGISIRKQPRFARGARPKAQSRAQTIILTLVMVGPSRLQVPIVITSKFLRSDRKSTRLNSSHVEISYAVFCLKKKNKKSETQHNNTTKKITQQHNTIPKIKLTSASTTRTRITTAQVLVKATQRH